MNSKKFLDQLGLIALISKIKQALNGKQNVDMVVTITQSGNAYSCDTSIANIVAAHDAGRDVYAVLPPVSDGSSTKIKLVDVQNYGSGTVIMVSFGGIINNGTNNVLYSVSGTRQNNLDAWSVSQKTMQEKLVSGTSIKTVNGNTLLGSGDVTINGSERVTATWNASTSAYVSGASVDNMYQSFYTDGKVLELHLVNGNYNGMVLTCHGGYTDGSVRHMKFSGVTDDWIVSCDVVGTVVTVTYTSLFDIYEELNGKQDTIGLNNKVDADYVEYRGTDTSRLGNGDSMTEALQTLDAAITNLGTPNEIASITTQESSASGGNNVVTITDTDGTSTSFNVKNGKDGKDGADGADGVSLGEIALVQTTGDATDEVMSQKAVSDRVERTDADLASLMPLPDGYTPLAYLDNGAAGHGAYINTELKPCTDGGWRFVGSWRRTGTPSTSGASIIFAGANYYRTWGIRRSGSTLDKIMVNGYQTQNTVDTIELSDNGTVWHTYDLKRYELILDGISYPLRSTTGSALASLTLSLGSSAYPQQIGRFLAYHDDVLVACLEPCIDPNGVYGMYDTVREQFFGSGNANAFSGAESAVSESGKLIDANYLSQHVVQYLGDSVSHMMSQDAITKELGVASSTWNTFTHVGGCLCCFDIADFPDFDLRQCEGVSIVIDSESASASADRWYFLLANDNSVSASNPTFAIARHYNSVFAGLQTKSGTAYNGQAKYFNVATYSHLVLTFDFKSGEYCLYKNGILFGSATPDNYDENGLQTIIQAATRIGLFTPTTLEGGQYTTSGYAVFGHALSANEVTQIFDSGNESTRGNILPEEYYSYQLKPAIITTWTLSSFKANYFTASRESDDGGVICTIKEGYSQIRFAFNIGSVPERFSGHCKREFDFTVLEGTVTYNHTQYSGNTYKNSATITDSGGNVVTFDTLGAGTYHFSCVPTIVKYPKGDTQLQVEHMFNVSEGASMWIHINYKVTDLGAALVCSKYNYRGAYWLQRNGYKIPVETETRYDVMACRTYNDTYKPDTVIYNSKVPPQFNGQIAVDSTNGKVYIGYLTGTGGTWKQINNS